MPTDSAHRSIDGSTVRPGGLDADFLRRVHRGDVALSALFGLLFAFAIEPMWGAGFFAMGLWSAANLWALERFLRAAIRPEGRDMMTIGVVGVIKLPLLYGALIAVLLWGGFPPVSVAAGLSVPLVVIFLVAARQVFAANPNGTAVSGSPASSEPRS